MTREQLQQIRDALAEGNGWAGHALADHDEKYARHPATEADREFITDSQNKIIEALRILDRALAAPEQEPVVYWDGDRSVIPADDLSYIPNWSDYYPTPLYRHPAPQSAQPETWVGAEEWESLAFELCAEEHGEEACNETVWENNEPWGDRWMKYEYEAKRMIQLVRKHTAPPAAKPWQSLTDEDKSALLHKTFQIFRAAISAPGTTGLADPNTLINLTEAALKEKNHG